MNIVAFIPARGGSKRVHRKNIKELCGRSLISYTIEKALSAGVSRVIVNTDDDAIATVAEDEGAEVQRRPGSLAKDKVSMHDLLRIEVSKLRPKPDAVLLLQPTVPFRSAASIKTAIGYFLAHADRYDSLISVERVPEKYNPYAMIIENQGKKMLFRKLIGFKEHLLGLFNEKQYVGPSLSGYAIAQRITRRQNFANAWLPDGSIYILKASNLKRGSMYGENTLLLEGEGALNIDDEDSWAEAERLCAQK